MSTEFELFKGKTLGSLFEDIYNNQTQKKAKIFHAPFFSFSFFFISIPQ